MTNELIYKQLLDNYGSIRTITEKVGCARNTVRNFLKLGFRSDYGPAILNAADELLKEIERQRQEEKEKREQMGKMLIQKGTELLATAS